MTERFFRGEKKILQMAFHVEKVKRALWRQHFVDQEQHVTFWWDCGKKTVQHNSNLVQLHAYESISESDSAFCGFWWGARSTTLIATEHFVDPKKWLHSFGNPYQIVYFRSKHLEKNNQLFTRLGRFFSSFGWSHVKERKSKVNGFTYCREPTNGCTKRHMLIDSRFFPMHYFFAWHAKRKVQFFLQNL